MENFNQLTEDYSRHRVPNSATVSGWRIALIILAATITLPIFLVGAQLGQSMGLIPSLIAFVIIGVVIATIASAVGIIATRSRLTTAMIMQFSFGRIGARIVSAIIGFAMLGWYGVTVDVFVRATQTLMSDVSDLSLSRNIYLFGASTLMILTTIFGFRGLDRLSMFAVPFLVIFLLTLVYTAIDNTGLSVIATLPGQGMSSAQGASAGIGGFIVGVTIFPDLCRYARNERDAVIAALLGLGLCVILVLVFATIPSIAVQESNFLQVVLLIGLGIPGIALILLATWTTNVYNLYSSSLVVANIILQVRKWKLVLVLGVIGAGIASIPILDNLITFLDLIAITIPPVAGVYMADFYIVRNQDYSNDVLESVQAFHPAGFVAWILGSLLAYLSNQGVLTLTTVAAIDAIVCAFITYTAWYLIFFKSKKFEKIRPLIHTEDATLTISQL